MPSLVLVMPFFHLVNLVLFEIHNFVLQAKFSFKVPWQSTNHQQAFVGLDCSCDLVDIWCTMGSPQGYRLGLLVDHIHSRPLLCGCRFHQVIDNEQVDDMLHSAQLLCGAVSLQRYNKYLISMTCIGSINHPHGESHVDPGRCVCCHVS